jgi:uncharacterized protein YceK
MVAAVLGIPLVVLSVMEGCATFTSPRRAPERATAQQQEVSGEQRKTRALCCGARYRPAARCCRRARRSTIRSNSSCR